MNFVDYIAARINEGLSCPHVFILTFCAFKDPYLSTSSFLHFFCDSLVAILGEEEAHQYAQFSIMEDL